MSVRPCIIHSLFSSSARLDLLRKLTQDKAADGKDSKSSSSSTGSVSGKAHINGKSSKRDEADDLFGDFDEDGDASMSSAAPGSGKDEKGSADSPATQAALTAGWVRLRFSPRVKRCCAVYATGPDAPVSHHLTICDPCGSIASKNRFPVSLKPVSNACFGSVGVIGIRAVSLLRHAAVSHVVLAHRCPRSCFFADIVDWSNRW